MYKLIAYIKSVRYRFNGILVKLFLQLLGCRVGKNFKCVNLPYFRILPYKNIDIGNNVTFGKDITLEVTPDGNLTIGNFVNLTQNIIVCVNKSVAIGNDVLVGENVSIRDGEHQTKRNQTIWKQPNNAEKIIIENDVWIGANCMILQNSIISNGCVVGAYSFIKNNQLKPYTIYAGNPLREIKKREE